MSLDDKVFPVVYELTVFVFNDWLVFDMAKEKKNGIFQNC